MNQIEIGKYIQKLRKSKNLKQSEFGDLFKVTDKSVSNWENGKSLPDIELLNEIANYFNITVDDILNCKKIPKNKKILKIINIVILVILIIISILLIFYIQDNKLLLKNYKIDQYRISSHDYNNKISGSILKNNDTYYIDIDTESCSNNNTVKYFEVTLTSDDKVIYYKADNEKKDYCSYFNKLNIYLKTDKLDINKKMLLIVKYITVDDIESIAQFELEIDSIFN